MEILIGLGGNLGNVPLTFAQLRSTLAEHLPLRGCSRLYRSAPVGQPQPPFFNACLLAQLTMPPAQLLSLCHRWEEQWGRKRKGEARWGPRTLDLDLLLVPGLVVEAPDLSLPHPRFHLRRFALLPAAELLPHLRHPRLGRTLEELARALPAEEQWCEPVGEFPR